MELHSHSFHDSQTSYVAPTWEQLDILTLKIAQEIQRDGVQIDRVVTLAKGGWPMTRSMVDYLNVEKVASIGVRFYSGINERLEKPEIYQDVPVSVAGEHVLLFDDVADTGESLAYIKEYLDYKNVASCTTASLFYKSNSKLTPDYFGAHTDDWIIFPFEILEMGKLLATKWDTFDISTQEKRAHFESLGFSNAQIEHIFSITNSSSKGTQA